ncbi:MAG: hypothetical protein EOP84_06670 [Verrucomicrobiaceae bacterium]|nr:MAG: hypothetical protein EOP84_06670 [Verrucomicrobiaceae bacterium]
MRLQLLLQETYLDKPRSAATLPMNTPFNLEASIAAWRTKFRSHEAISHSEVEELESHLRDSIDDLTQSGLSLEESFLLARHRLGGENVAEEIHHSDPARLWASRARWMFLGVLSYFALTSLLAIVGGAIQIATALFLPGATDAARLAAFFASCVSLGLFVWILWQVAQGRWHFSKIKRLAPLHRPWLLAFSTAGVVILGRFIGAVETMSIVRSLGVQSYGQVIVTLQWFGLGEALLLLVAVAFAADWAKQAAKN